MNSLNGFVKLHRKLIAWGWYQDYVVKDVFLHLLLTANFKRTEWQGKTLEEGQVVISYQKIANELGFGVRRVRTAIEKLKLTREITTEPTSRFTVVTIVNWRDYQFNDGDADTESDTNIDKRPTRDRHATDMRPTRDRQQRKNGKNVKNDKNGKKRVGTPAPHGTFNNVFLTVSELDDLRHRYPNHYKAKIDRLSRYIENNPGRSYANHYAVLMDWLIEDVGKVEPPTSDNRSAYDIDELDQINTLDFIE